LQKVKNLRVHYGTVEAVKGVSFQVSAGTIVSLIGANGAGKTTSLRALTGLVKPSGGELRFQNASLIGLAPHQIVGLGIAHVPEGRRLFSKMTVVENLRMGAYLRTSKTEIAATLGMIYQHFPILQERGRQLAGSLSGGEQQMLALGRGLMAQPDLLLLDEPSQGLGPRIVEQIFETIDRIRRERRLTILLVEQRVVEALELCDRGYVLETGRVVLDGGREALLADTRVQRAYLGG